MHLAAHHMVRHLTAGMAMITCREALLVSIANNLKAAFVAAIRVGKTLVVCAITEEIPWSFVLYHQGN